MGLTFVTGLDDAVDHFNDDALILKADFEDIDFPYIGGAGRSRFRSYLVQVLDHHATSPFAEHGCLAIVLYLDEGLWFDLKENSRDCSLILRQFFGGQLPETYILPRENPKNSFLLKCRDEVSQKNPKRDALTKLYSPSATIPNMSDVFINWMQRSHDIMDQKYAEISYGAGDAETIDLFLPAVMDVKGQQDKIPLHVFIHGGYWQAMDKQDHAFLASAFIKNGVAFASINYDLCPDVSLDQIFEQIKSALSKIENLAATYGYQDTGYQLSGHSAGAQLAAMAGCDDQLHMGHFVLISGVYDLEPLRHTAISDPLGLDKAGALRNSPIFKTPVAGRDGIVVVGGDESSAFIEQSKDLVQAWGKIGVNLSYMEINGGHHFSVVEDMVCEGHPLYEAVFSYFEG